MSNLGSNTQNFLCQCLPGSSDAKQDLLRANSSLQGSKDPAGLRGSHASDYTLGFGNVSWEAHLGTATLPKLPGGT